MRKQEPEGSIGHYRDTGLTNTETRLCKIEIRTQNGKGGGTVIGKQEHERNTKQTVSNYTV